MSAPGPRRRAPRDAVGGRRCASCGTLLAADNTARLCGSCYREQHDQLRAPPAKPRAEFFETDEFRAAFESQHIGRVFKAYRNHPRYLQLLGKALNQEILGRWLGLNQAQVSRIEKGEQEQSFKTLQNYAKILHLPQHMLWFDLPGQSRLKPLQSPLAAGLFSDSEEADRLAVEILDSTTADEAINQLAYAVTSLAESHTQAPARLVLNQLFHLHRQAQVLLEGRQRLGQKRELFRIESDLLAHACLLLDDLKQNEIAQRYGAIALSFAKEAGTGEATARTSLAKALRWAERLIESADMAKIGYERSGATPIRIQLASQEANAAALMGNIARAHEALMRAEAAAETIPTDSGTSAWSFPIGRQAIFALSVALQAEDPDTALRAVARADASWKSGDPFNRANWAQIRAGASIAYLLKGSLDAAIDEVAPVLALPPELRISTVTAYLEKLDRQLREPRYQGDSDVAKLRERIRDFNSAALLSGSE